MHIWYLVTTTTCMLFVLNWLLIRALEHKERKIFKILRTGFCVLEFLMWGFTIFWSNMGYIWINEAWSTDIPSKVSLPIRYKWIFVIIEFLLSFYYFPIILVPVYIANTWIKHLKKEAERIRLRKYLKKIYNPKFNFNEILPQLKLEFFTQPLSKKELKNIKKLFSRKLLPNDTECCNLDDVCPICFSNYNKGEKITTIPGCTHNFHFNCKYHGR